MFGNGANTTTTNTAAAAAAAAAAVVTTAAAAARLRTLFYPDKHFDFVLVVYYLKNSRHGEAIAASSLFYSLDPPLREPHIKIFSLLSAFLEAKRIECQCRCG